MGFVHPLDLLETDRGGRPVEGMVPVATLGEHATLALERLREWLELAAHGKVVRTRTGARRVMPRSVRIIARSYIYDHLDRAWFQTSAAFQYARRYYTYALEVRIAEKLEDVALLLSDSDVVVRNHARPWRKVAMQLGLPLDDLRGRPRASPRGPTKTANFQIHH